MRMNEYKGGQGEIHTFRPGDLAGEYEAWAKSKGIKTHYGTSEGVMKAWDTRGRGRKIEYKPAKTREEAEKFALDNLIDPKERERVEKWNSGETAHLPPERVQQIKIISYKGIDPKVANEINKNIAKNIELGLPQPSSIIATQMRKTPNVLMSMGTDVSLRINTLSMGNMEKIKKGIQEGKELYHGKGQEMMKELEQNVNSMTPAQKKKFDSLKDAMKYSRDVVGHETDTTPERMIEATINHEIAHTLAYRGKYGYDTPQHEEFLEGQKRIAEVTLNSDYRYKLSSYGCKAKDTGLFHYPVDKEETFAELYSAYRFHEDDNLHPEALAFFKKYLPER